MKIVLCGSTLVTPAFDPGLLIVRAVFLGCKPRNIGRLSYPPINFVTRNGRLNAAGEVLFYGAVGVPFNSLYECRAKAGDTFAVGFWRTTRKIVLNHMGYSNAEVNALAPGRPMQDWMNAAADGTRDQVLSSWVSRAFTRKINDGEEHLYNLSIALARFALDEVKDVAETGHPPQIDGVIYPSISTKLYGNNVALRPAVVDSSLILEKVMFVRVRRIPEIEYRGEAELGTVELDVFDTSRAQYTDGRLIWSTETTRFSVERWVSAK